MRKKLCGSPSPDVLNLLCVQDVVEINSVFRWTVLGEVNCQCVSLLLDVVLENVSHLFLGQPNAFTQHHNLVQIVWLESDEDVATLANNGRDFKKGLVADDDGDVMVR